MTVAAVRPPLPATAWLWAICALCGSLAFTAFVFTRQPLLALGLLAVPALIASFAWSDVATLLVLLLLYTNAPVVGIKYHGVPFIVAAAVPLLLFLPVGRHLLAGRKLLITPAVLAFTAFFVVQVLGLLLCTRPELGAKELLNTLLEGFLLYLLILNAIRSPEVLRRSVRTLIVAGALMGGIVGYQQFTRTFDNRYGGFAQLSQAEFDTGDEEKQVRLSGSIGEQNRFAQVLAVLMPLALLRIYSSRSRLEKLLCLLALIVISVGFSLAFSRGGAIGVAMMFLIMIAMGYVRARHLPLIAAAGLLVALLVPQYAARLSKIQDVAVLLADSEGPGLDAADGATRGRVAQMTAAALMFADHPLLGVGPGMYREHYREYTEIAGLMLRDQKRESHSLYLGLAAEHGMLGLLTFGLLIALTFHDLVLARRAWLPVDREQADLQASLIMALVVYLTTAVFLHLGFMRFFAIPLGLAAAASQLRPQPLRASGALARRLLRGSLVGRPAT